MTNKFKCTYCDKEYAMSVRLRIHMLKHRKVNLVKKTILVENVNMPEQALHLQDMFTEAVNKISKIAREQDIHEQNKIRRLASEELGEFCVTHNLNKRWVEYAATKASGIIKLEDRMKEQNKYDINKPFIMKRRIFMIDHRNFAINDKDNTLLLRVEKKNPLIIKLPKQKNLFKHLANKWNPKFVTIAGSNNSIAFVLEKEVPMRDAKKQVCLELDEQGIAIMSNDKAYTFIERPEIKRIAELHKLYTKIRGRIQQGLKDNQNKRRKLLRKYGRRETNRVKKICEKLILDILYILDMSNYSTIAVRKWSGYGSSSYNKAMLLSQLEAKAREYGFEVIRLAIKHECAACGNKVKKGKCKQCGDIIDMTKNNVELIQKTLNIRLANKDV